MQMRQLLDCEVQRVVGQWQLLRVQRHAVCVTNSAGSERPLCLLGAVMPVYCAVTSLLSRMVRDTVPSRPANEMSFSDISDDELVNRAPNVKFTNLMV